ncbi:MAG: FHA domain-containing protein [Saprospiraceae bacterium]|nr:MAG: FHA domain protein [Candidatus Parvibacillus calidus]MCC7147585.1 FHA domain-containing protein [Saprospiraceae bacterium]
MELKCPFCDERIILANIEKYVGKQIRVKCVNKSCQQYFVTRVPDSSDKTIVFPAGSVKTRAKLTVLASKFAPFKEYYLGEGNYIVGRYSIDSIANIAILTTDKLVSRQHCEITGRQNADGGIDFTIKDAGSKNFIYINNRQLESDEEIYLNEKDIIRLGRIELQFHRD